MQAYRSLKARLIAEFASDAQLCKYVAAATTLDEILGALAANYRAWLLAAAQAGSGSTEAASIPTAAADVAADAREKVILELLSFFERDRAATANVEVRRTGPRQLRVVCRQPAAPADSVAAY